MRRLLEIMALAMGLAAFVACGGATVDPDVDISLRDFEIELSIENAPSGQLTFEATNAGPSVHEFELFSVPEGVDLDAIAIEDSVADVESAGLELVDEVEDIAPGTSASVTVSLDPGTYAIVCNLSGHFAQGMHASFTVQ